MADHIEALAATPKSVAHLVADCDDIRIDAVPNGAPRSARATMIGLRDAESLRWRLALERALAEDDPDIAEPDLAGWERRRKRERDAKTRLLADFALQRQASLARLEALVDEDWERPLRIAGERLTVESLAERWAQSDAAAIEAIEQALGTTLNEVLLHRFSGRSR